MRNCARLNYLRLQMIQNYKIRLEQFEGPFDLLLFFIERDEIDIYDIPIAKITQDFLEYIRSLENRNLDVASEFILMAATLMKIKARSLIPRKPLDEDGNEIDPRKELVQKLLEYKRYKDIIDDIQELENKRKNIHGRGGVAGELKDIANKAMVDLELESLTMFKLLKAFDNVTSRFKERKNRTFHEIVKFPYTIESQTEMIYAKLRQGSKRTFKGLFEGITNRVEAITTFLALLELCNNQSLEMVIGDGNNNFWVSLKEQAVHSSEEE